MTMTLDEIRHSAGKLERRVWWRNLREYGAGALVVAYLAPYLWKSHGWHALPPALMIAGTLFVLWELHRRGRAHALPSDVGLRASLSFHRRELERQRDALRGVLNWYLLPLVPGIASVYVDAYIGHGFTKGIAWGVLFAIVVFAGVWALNSRGARHLDRQIAELAALDEHAPY